MFAVKSFPAVPVILMTAHGSEETAVQALQRGAAGYVPKGISRRPGGNDPERAHDSKTSRSKHRLLESLMQTSRSRSRE